MRTYVRHIALALFCAECCLGIKSDARKVLSFVERTEELPSFTIELQLYVAIPRRALKSLKKRDFGVGLLWYDFSDKID